MTADPMWGLPQRGSSAEALAAAFPFLRGSNWDISALDDAGSWCEAGPLSAGRATRSSLPHHLFR